MKREKVMIGCGEKRRGRVNVVDVEGQLCVVHELQWEGGC